MSTAILLHPIHRSLSKPGEYRVDLSAYYQSPAARPTWERPLGRSRDDTTGPDAAGSHGRRGVDCLKSIPNHWFVSAPDLASRRERVPHPESVLRRRRRVDTDERWRVRRRCSAAGRERARHCGEHRGRHPSSSGRMEAPLSAPGTAEERFAKGEIPLFSSTRNAGRPVGPRIPGIKLPTATARPASSLRVREFVAEDERERWLWPWIPFTTTSRSRSPGRSS